MAKKQNSLNETQNNADDPDRTFTVQTDENALVQKTISNAEKRNALCNDETPFTYYVRPGDEAHRNKWVIYFQGGGACTSVEACEARITEDPDLITAATIKKRQSDGILSTDENKNPDFYNWSQIFLPYCSSDTWSGTKENTEQRINWVFYGHYIVQAIFEDLLTGVEGMPALKNAEEVIIGGSSAGGGGVQLNLDRIAEMINTEQKIPVAGILDSTWSFEIEPYTQREDAYGNTPTENEANEFQGTVGDESCETENSNATALCRTTETLLPYLTTPVFIYIDQGDQLKLSRLGIDNFQESAQRKYWDEIYRPALLASLEGLEGLFAPLAGKHTALTGSRFYTIEIEGLTFKDILGNWYFKREGPTTMIAEKP